MEAIAWKYRTGAPWRDLPEALGSFKTAHKPLLRWAVDGTWARIFGGWVLPLAVERWLAWPGNYVAELANPTVAGLERYGDTQLYVTRGAGAWGPPVRVGAPSDITVLTLASLQA
ncbi:hypothetical protein KCMC57_up05910 [Kitasatospora sp. CMC57]|uniref:Insertion element IS402-like domain-containing protein n=1 Tax=Kitasatospora sp. CMC57 TaxID=3231513 RepID=A0AB33JSE4_9ACTN